MHIMHCSKFRVLASMSYLLFLCFCYQAYVNKDYDYCFVVLLLLTYLLTYCYNY